MNCQFILLTVVKRTENLCGLSTEVLKNNVIFIQIGVWFFLWGGRKSFMITLHEPVLGDSMDCKYRNIAEMRAHTVWRISRHLSSYIYINK